LQFLCFCGSSLSDRGLTPFRDRAIIAPRRAIAKPACHLARDELPRIGGGRPPSIPRDDTDMGGSQ